jgi:hypothetical protein
VKEKSMKLIKAFEYRRAFIPGSYDFSRWQSYDTYQQTELAEDGDLHRCMVDRDLVKGLERELVKLANWPSPDNHCVFVYEDDSGRARAVWFHDFNAIFGYPGDVRPTAN